MMKGTNKNRGAAMISVMIAMTFLMLLSTSLLYMTYMNYLVKSSRYFSTDNFYTDEFALADLTSSLQQIGANATGSTTGMTAVENAVKAGSGKWDPAKLQALITLASKEATITVDCPDGKTPDMVRSGGNLTLKNVRLTSKTEEGFESRIVTDITLTWPVKPERGFSIYDFSMITDADIQVGTGYNGINLTIGGCLYCRQIHVTSHSICTLTSPMAIIHGDLYVDDGCVLMNTGDTYVTGDLIVSGSGILINTGTLTCAGKIEAEYKGTAPVRYGSSSEDRSRFAQQFNDLAGDNGLATSLVDFEVPIVLANGSNTIVRTANELNEGDYWFDQHNGIIGSNNSINAYTTGAALEDFNGSSMNNSLVISNRPTLNVREDFSNSTFISSSHMTIIFTDENRKPTYMSRMTEDSYNAACNILYWAHNEKTIPDSSGTNYKDYFYSSGVFSDFIDADGNIRDAYSSTVSAFETKDFDINGRTVTRTYYQINDDGTIKNLLPVGSLISPMAEAIINEMCNTVKGSSPKPEDSFVTYQNWYKE